MKKKTILLISVMLFVLAGLSGCKNENSVPLKKANALDFILNNNPGCSIIMNMGIG